MMRQKDWQRLYTAPLPDAQPEGVAVVACQAHCPGNAEAVLTRIQEVLDVVLRYDEETWPADERWRVLLPSWFVERCAPETSREDSEAWLAWWRTLPAAQQAEVAANQPWSVSDWVYWLHPSQREWYWWQATVETSAMLRIDIEINGWPFPSGALVWLLKASGAQQIEI